MRSHPGRPDFRKLSDAAREARRGATEFERNVLRFLRMVIQHGKLRACEMEIDNPGWDDADWCRRIVKLRTEIVAKTAAEEVPF